MVYLVEVHAGNQSGPSTSAARASSAQLPSSYQTTSLNLSFSAYILSMSPTKRILSHLKWTIHGQSDISAHFLYLFNCLPFLRPFLPFTLPTCWAVLHWTVTTLDR